MTFATVDSADNNRIICQGQHGRTIIITVSNNVGVSGTHIIHSNTTPVLFKLIYRFSETKTFRYVWLHGTPFSVVGVSLTHNPTGKQVFIGSSAVNLEENKPNIVAGSKEFSLNDVFSFDNLTGLTRTQEGIVSATATCPWYFVMRGGYKQCVRTCDGPFVRNSQGEKECYGVTGDDSYCEYKMGDETQNCLSASCSLNQPPLLFKDSIDSKFCLETCEGANSYQKFNVCLSKCDNFVSEVVNFRSSDERGKCEDECSFLTVESNLFLWKDGSEKKYCVTDCESVSLTHPFLTEDKRCVEDCYLAGFAYLLVDSKTCSNDCSGFVWEGNKCLEECPEEAPIIENNSCVRNCSAEKPFIKEFKECVSECENLRFEEFCVDSCEEESLIQYFQSKNRIYTPMPFILSNKQCSQTCLEPNMLFINSITNECVSACPPCEGEGCQYSHLKYKEGFYCKTSCSSAFPLRDEISMECFTECTSERPFQFNNHCLAQCPPSHPMTRKISNCTENECNYLTKQCFSSCPIDFSLEVLENNETICVSSCPTNYKQSGNKCELYCNTEKGFITAEDGLSCINCFKDFRGMFQYQNKCVESCPKGLYFNQNFSCKPCFELDLWENEENKCIPLSLCNHLSYFDYEKKTCTLCEGGLKIVKIKNTFTCEKTDCSQGFISSELSQPICIICESTELFADPDCEVICPLQTEYRFGSKRCSNCSEPCSCCKYGDCTNDTCICDKGWSGLYCDIRTDQQTEISSTIIEFLTTQLPKNILYTNQSNLLAELDNIYQNSLNQRELEVNSLSIKGLLNNILVYFDNNHIKYSYQPYLLETLDRTIKLAHSYSNITKDTYFLEEFTQILFEYSNQIQLFNTTTNTTPEFEVVNQASYQGNTFYLSFGPDVVAESSVDITDCIPIIKDSFQTDSNLPFRVIRFYNITVSVPEEAFVASSAPQTFLWIYTPSGVIDLNSICDSRFIGTTFQVELAPLDPVSQRINLLGVDIFNKEDSFFNDRCVPFSDETDLTLNQRKAQFFLDPKIICKESPFQICKIQYEDRQSVCNCKGVNNTPKSQIETSFADYPKSNYALISCLKVFKSASLTSNPGFYAIIIPCCICILLMFYCGFKVDKDLTGKKRFQYMRTDIEIFDPTFMDIEAYFKECFNIGKYSKKAAGGNKKLSRGRVRKAEFDFDSLPTLPDLAKLPSDKRLSLDKRPTWQYTFDTLFSFNTLLYNLFSPTLLEPKPFLILLYVCELNLSATLNAFFIDDDLVEAFSARNNSSLFASIREELSKTIWALLTSKALMSILTIFYTFNQRTVNLLIKRLMLTKDQSAVKAYNLFLTKHRFRLTIMTVLAIPFNLFCLYFVVIYAEIYPKSIDIWFNGIIISFLIDNLVIQGIPAVVLIASRTLAKTFPQLEFLFKLVSNVEMFKVLKALR